MIDRFPLGDRNILPLNKSRLIGGVRFKAAPVEHSIRAPAVGYRIWARGTGFFYVPDVAGLPNVRSANQGLDVYIGDGATLKRSMARNKDGTRIAHASIIDQLGWCRKAGIPRAIFTHCGSPIVRADASRMNAALQQLGRDHGVEARFACDGDRLFLADGRQPRWTRNVLEPAEDHRSLAFNLLAAERLREAATLLEHQDDNPFRVAAYRRAADAVAALVTDLRELLESGGIESLQTIPGVGPRIAGGWLSSHGLGVGPISNGYAARASLAMSSALSRGGSHQTLHVETLEQLEAALHAKDRQAVAGIGPRRLALLRAALSQMLARIRPTRIGPSDEPPVSVLLDVDREYRAKAAADKLKKIAPKRFNPKGGAWLPILHAEQVALHCGLQYCARA